MRSSLIVPLAAAGLILSACGSSSPVGETGGGGGGNGNYDVTVTRTALGIPHINANDYASLGYGYGYAFAEDNVCVLQEDLVTIRGERARYFGRGGTDVADGSYTIHPNGVTADNVTSDYFWRFAATDAAIQPTKDATLPEFKEVVRGFVDGYNRYVRELKGDQHAGRHARCADADWLFEIEADDLYRRFYRLALIASTSVFINEIVAAQPPALAAAAAADPSVEAKRAALAANPGPFAYFTEQRKFGSNMYALSKDATSDGSSMVFGNPHFPWIGTERLYISHVTIPGELDIMGSSLYGVPAILIGFNDHFAWSHTVSTAYRFTLYELTLNPANPMQYLYDGGLRDIEAVPVTIEVKQNDGSLVEESRTLYRSHYGPMFSLSVEGVPVLGWTPLKAYTLRDANAENNRLINQFAKWNQAESLDEFIALHKSILGIPWVNTVASGPGGKAYYGDVSVVPNVPDSKVQTCQAIPLHQAIQQLVPGLPLLDGSRADCEWDTDPDAPAPGIFGPSNLPTLQRDDWVHNCNDSYWLTNPAEPITGYNRIIGDENAERSMRTRLCILHIQRRLDGSDGRPGNTFDLETLQDVVLSSEIYTAQLERDNVVGSI
ncbi:MAG: penicillin acylase family protein, partial [Gammaproteobacteria bacterium]